MEKFSRLACIILIGLTKIDAEQSPVPYIIEKESVIVFLLVGQSSALHPHMSGTNGSFAQISQFATKIRSSPRSGHVIHP